MSPLPRTYEAPVRLTPKQANIYVWGFQRNARFRDAVYVPCPNTASTPSEHFRLAPEDFAAAEDRSQVLAVVHSHPDHPAAPSEADRVSCEASGIPWHILEVRKGDDEQVRSGELVSFAPEGYQAPLIGRKFATACPTA